MSPKRYRIATLGCRTNQYESQGYRTQLEALGLEPAKEGEPADLCIVNTCTVTASADQSSRLQIRRLIRENPGAQIAVTGCLVESGLEGLRAIEGISHLVPNRSKEKLIEQLFPGHEEYPEFRIDHFAAHTRAFVKVQDGCNSFCTYCIIPYVRGRSRSRRIGDVISEIEGLVDRGYREVVLTGINIGDFDGGDGSARLADLVRAADRVEGLQRVRISSIDADEVDDDLAEAVLYGRNTCASMHIVLQAGSNAILKRMNRKYTRQLFLETVNRLRGADPDFTFTTDVIVGFPGETEEDFQQTIEMIAEVRFASIHLFPYSDRPRTRAALYPNKISPQVMSERKARLKEVSSKQAFNLREEFVGRTMTVLTEEQSCGHTDNFLRVSIEGSPIKANEMVQVQLLANRPDGLVGRRVSCA